MPKEVAQAVEVIATRAKEEGEEPSKINLSFLEIFEVALTETKVEEDLRQMIACVPDPNSRGRRRGIYTRHVVRIGCIHSHNIVKQSLLHR